MCMHTTTTVSAAVVCRVLVHCRLSNLAHFYMMSDVNHLFWLSSSISTYVDAAKTSLCIHIRHNLESPIRVQCHAYIVFLALLIHFCPVSLGTRYHWFLLLAVLCNVSEWHCQLSLVVGVARHINTIYIHERKVTKSEAIQPELWFMNEHCMHGEGTHSLYVHALPFYKSTYVQQKTIQYQHVTGQ